MTTGKVMCYRISFSIDVTTFMLSHNPQVLPHGLAILSLFCSLISGQGLVYLDVLGKKHSKLYIFNGIALFLGWLVARILLFVYFFYHLYWLYDEVKTLFPLAFWCCIMGPPVLGGMNLIWFFKIAKGTVKVLSKARFSD